MLTIDANVFVAARVKTRSTHTDSDQFLSRLALNAIRIYCPALVLPEAAAAVVRVTGRVSLTNAALRQIINFPSLTLVDLTADRARSAADVAIACRLRGADAICVAVAQEYGTTLITWDQELLTRGTAAVTIMTPADWLAANPI